MECHKGSMDDYRDDGQVEIVKHNMNVLVDASLEAKVQTKYAATDVL